MTRPGNPTSAFAARLALIAAFALGARLLYVFVVARAPVGVGGDAGFYHSAANLIANGHFYYREIFGRAYATAEHPPLFSLVLSVSSLLGGTSLEAHRVVGCAVGTAGVVVLGLLGREAFDPQAGLLAAGLAAGCPPFITADGLVMSEPLFVLGMALLLLLAVRIHRRPTTRGCVLLGGLIGLCTLTRSEGLLLLVLLGVPVAWASAAGRGVRVVTVIAATALVLAPWVIRNAITFHRLMLAGDAATVIAGANCRQTYHGNDIGWWSLRCLERSRTHSQLLAGDASTGAGFRYAAHHLGRLPLVAAVRLLRTFDLYQPLRQGNREPRRRWVDVLGLVFYLPILVLAALRLARLHAGRWLWLAPIWMVAAVSILGWGIGRFRVGADVSLLVLAGSTIADWIALRSRRGART